MNEVIKITNVWAGYQQKEVLEDINLTVKEQDFLGLIGPNGGGKTTLINSLVKILESNFIIAKVSDPDIECIEFFNFLAESLQINKKFTSKGAFFVHFNFFLKTALAATIL